MNSMDYREALSYHLGELHKRVIEVYESTLEDWNKALDSKFVEKREQVYMNREELTNLPLKSAFVHITDLSSKVTEKDIIGFFAY